MNNNLQNLKIHDLPYEAKDGARMILPGDLQQLLDIFPRKQVLIVDLRPTSAFEKSHIHEAINLRAPVSFIEHTSLEMIQDTIPDDQSRRTFAKWSQSRCVVFYDRVVEFSWECPVADVLYDKFRRKGWNGECFILKGHFHEFSSSFDKYISGNKMTKQAKNYLDGLRQHSTTASKSEETEKRYKDWLREQDDSDRAPTELIPSKKADRVRAVEEHQHELEAELKTRFPALYKKALGLRPPTRTPSYRTIAESAPTYDVARKDGKSDDFDPGLVEPLVRGLEKMREAAAEASSGRQQRPMTPLPQYNKASTSEGEAAVDKAGDPLGTPTSEDFDDFETDEGLRSDPGFQRAGTVATRGGEDEPRKGKSQHQSFWSRYKITAKPGSK